MDEMRRSCVRKEQGPNFPGKPLNWNMDAQTGGAILTKEAYVRSPSPGLPSQSDLEAIQMRPRNYPFVLQHADNNPGSDALPIGKCGKTRALRGDAAVNRFHARLGINYAGMPGAHSFASASSPVSPPLNSSIIRTFLAVKQNARSLMEETELHMVVVLMVDAQLYDSRPRREPPSRAAKSRLR